MIPLNYPYRIHTVEELEDLLPEVIKKSVVAKHHSRVRRWNGWSGSMDNGPTLAAHVLVMRDIVEEYTPILYGFGEELELLCLLHDAEEVLTGDIPSPVKKLITDQDTLSLITQMVLDHIKPDGFRPKDVAWMKALDDIAWRAESVIMHGETEHTPSLENDWDVLEVEIFDRMVDLYNEYWDKPFSTLEQKMLTHLDYLWY